VTGLPPPSPEIGSRTSAHGAVPASRRPSVPPAARVRSGAVWAVPALLTAAIGATGLGDAQLWRDELAAWSGASRPVGDLLRMVGNIDAVSGAYYLFLHYWIALFGDSVTALRAPSVLAMAAAAGFTAALGTRLYDARAGLLAGLLFAVLPSTSRYAQEARSYAFVSCFAVLATLLLVAALHRPTRLRWLGYTAAVALLGLMNLVALTLLAGHLVLVALSLRGRDRRWWHWAVTVAVAGLLVAPLALLGLGQQSQQLNWVDTPAPGELLALPGALTQAAAVGGMLLGLAAVGLGLRARPGIALAACVLAPVVLVFAAAQLTPLWVVRYLVFTLPFACLLAGAALAGLRLTYALLVLAVLAVLGAPAQAALRRTHEWPRSAAIDYAAAAGAVAAGQRPGDGIVYSPRTGSWPMLDLAMEYHLRDDRPRDVLAATGRRERADLWVGECPRPAECLAGVERVWLLVRGDHDDPVAALADGKRDALRAGYRVERSRQLPGLTLALLVRTG